MAAKTYRSTRHLSPDVLIQSSDRMLTGWANYHLHNVAEAAFSKVHFHAWGRIMRWLRHKHGWIGMPELRRRLCVPGTWTFAYNGVVFKGASSVPITRYRYRCGKIPTPFIPNPQAASSG